MGDERLLLCADGGGTSVSVVISTPDGREYRGEGGPCNIYHVGLKGAVAAILSATYAALEQLPSGMSGLQMPADRGSPLAEPVFRFTWLALAGISQPSDGEAFMPHIIKALNIEEKQCSITNDVNLLAAPALARTGITHAIGLVAGTGQKAVAIRKLEHADGGLPLQDVGESGGWGYVFDDTGSAYCIGLAAVQSVLRAADRRASSQLYSAGVRSLSAFHQAILDHFGVSAPLELFDIASLSSHKVQGMDIEEVVSRRTALIASVARVVLQEAYPTAGGGDLDALTIATSNMDGLISRVLDMLGDGTVVKLEETMLSLGGGLWASEGFRLDFLKRLSVKLGGAEFAEVLVVHDAASAGVRGLMGARTLARE